MKADALMGKGPQAPAAPAATMGKGGKGGKGEAKADFRGPAGLFVAAGAPCASVGVLNASISFSRNLTPSTALKRADWDCSVCGNTNWARRQTCNMCQSAKPNVVAVRLLCRSPRQRRCLASKNSFEETRTQNLWLA